MAVSPEVDVVRKEIELWPHQYAALQATERVVAIMGGIGCGKSQYLAYEQVQWVNNEDPRSQTIAVANTHEQLDKSFLARLKQVLSECSIDFVHGRQPPESWNVPNRERIGKWTNVITLETGHVIVTYSLDRPHGIRGSEFGLALCDELAFAPDGEGFDIILGRMRCQYAKNIKIRIATSPPDDFNWFWEVFIGPQKREGYKVFHGATTDNKTLPAEYLDLLSGYSAADYDREVRGLFVPRGTNRCYSEYQPNKHDIPWEYIEGLEVYAGCDFNRSPLSWVFCQIDQNDVIHVFDELWIEREATTIQACQETRQRFGDAYIIAYPDITAGLTRTSGVLGLGSDLEILEDAGFDVVTPFAKNPLQEERIESVQERLRDSLITVDPSCAKLRESLLSTMHQPGTRKIMKTRKIGVAGEHPTDALGYLVHGYDFNVGVQPFKYGYR